MFKYNIEYQNDAGIWVELKNWVRPIMNKSTLDETHDETQIFLSCSPITEPFKPFTKFIINITEVDENDNIIDVDTLYRVVIADEITQVVFEQTEDENGNIVDGLYDHDIRLAEATKELERYTVDNLSFTNEWKKAFSTSTTSAYIRNQVLSNDFYNNTPLIDVNIVDYLFNQRIFAFRMDKKYRTYEFANDKVNKDNTYVASLLKLYSNYIIPDINSNIVQNSSIQIPAVETISANDTLIFDEKVDPLTAVTGFFQLTDYYADINNFKIKTYLIYPSGIRQEVSSGNSIRLSQTGKYSIQYEITRQVRMKKLTHQYRFWVESETFEPEYTEWLDGLTTYIVQDFYVTDGNLRTTDKLTISDILHKIVNVTPTNFEKPASLFIIDSSVEELYGSYEAPEMIFTNKNLWEVLREIGGVINAIPYLKIDNKETWNNIAYLPLSSEEPVKDTVEEEYCNSTSYYDSENYTASYDLSVDNMINPYADYEGVVHEQGWFIAKTIRSEEFEISETSMNIETAYPIYTINHLYFIDMTNNTRTALDNFVYEKSLYNTLVSNTVSQGQAVALYYTQGKPNIYGLQFKVSQNEYDAAEKVVSIRNVLAAAGVGNAQTINLLNCKFVIEYTPFLNARIKYYKTNAPRLNIKTSMFQNQSANVVDARSLGRKMVANIGRVGNLGYVDSIKTYTLKAIPLKGQRARDGYFVSTVTTEYDQNHLLSSVQYTKDYQKISDFINIQNLQRFYEVSEKQSIDRYINTHMFYIFGDSVPEINKQYGLNYEIFLGRNYLANMLIGQNYPRKINGSILKAYSYNDNDEEILVSYLYLNSNAIATGNNISIITDFYDNYGAGYQAYDYDTNPETQAYMSRLVPYADKKGRISRLDIRNVTDSNINYGAGSAELEDNFTILGHKLPQITAIYPESDIEKAGLPNESEIYLKVANKYNENNYTGDNMPTVVDVGCHQNIYIEKDSREVLHINQQHHFLTNDNNVIIGRAMTEYCRYIQDREFDCRLVFLKNKIDDYEFKIKESDIIAVNVDNTIPQTQELNDLCTKITANNVDNILSDTSNTTFSEFLYLQPMLNNQGYVFGLSENAKAWAIITKSENGNDNNELIIGRNEDIKAGLDGSPTTQINMSVTSEY